MTFGSLFAGIGGLDLGLERAGMTCRWQVEIDEYCRRVLAKHWPNVDRWDDVRTFPPGGDWSVELIAGGFPCTDISKCRGKDRQYLDGENSGLWHEYSRIIRIIRPKYILVENTPEITLSGLDRILSDLANLGYDAEWDLLSAEAFGAPQLRERIFVVGYTNSNCQSTGTVNDEAPRMSPLHDTTSRTDHDVLRPAQLKELVCEAWDQGTDQSPVLGVANGVPNRVDRLRSLGNAVVPQVAEFIGRRIIAAADTPEEP